MYNSMNHHLPVKITTTLTITLHLFRQLITRTLSIILIKCSIISEQRRYPADKTCNVRKYNKLVQITRSRRGVLQRHRDQAA